ncbi:MAG: bifunctional glycoside hydrolase 114/ polysaccharide deacetylase family protein [Burkholderiales bacterium]
MLVTMLRRGVGLFLCLSMCSFAASPNVAFFYGAQPPWDELRAFDVVVVEPGHDIDPKLHSTPHTEIFAYVSVGEVERDRPYFGDLPAGWAPGANAPWKSVVVDQTQPEWPNFLVERIVVPLWQAGYRGLFLDNLDSFHIIAKTDEQRAEQVRGLIAAVRAIRARFPEAKLIFNRGFEILPELHREAYAVAVESIFRGWDPKQARYIDVPASDRSWLLTRLQRVTQDYKLPVIAIDYTPPAARALARDTARKISELGFVPWVTNSTVDQLGVGSIEVMPRKVLMLYDGDGNEFNTIFERVHRLAAMPINYLGYVPEYVDINRTLPAHTLVGRYAGIVSWFLTDRPGRNPAFREWLATQVQDGVRIAALGNLGFPLGDPLSRALGLSVGIVRGLPGRISIESRDPLIGFESEPFPDRRAFVPLRAQKATSLLRLRSETGDTMDAAALTSWGGYVLAPFDFIALADDRSERWVVQPIEFFRRALALPAMPVPDVTTENGRRLMLVHIDGDGFVNRAEIPGTPFAGEALRREILQRYRIPTAVSVIQGEVAANGLYPKLSPQLERISRAIFSMPHVEIASHTYSHPFRWGDAAARADDQQYHLNLPGYRFSLNAEIPGSVEYINSRLAPKDKRTRILLWSGDSNPGRDAVALAYRTGVLNMNGGDTWITRSEKTLSLVGPLGIDKGGQFQVFAPNQNENVYTNNWTGPFYGFERVIETFQLTDTPYRLKPIDIYYHAYSASKRASLNALHKVYQWALSQRVMNIYPSQYIEKVLDFNRMVVARASDGWLIRGDGAVRELRMPSALGVPSIATSRAIAGYEQSGNQVYVHLAEGDARLELKPQSAAEPYVVEANGRIERWARDGSTLQFGVNAYVPLRFALANVAACRVDGDGSPLSGVTQGGITRYELKHNGIERVSITCAP